MASIGFGGGGSAAAHGIKIPNQVRIAAPSLRGSDFLDGVFSPEAAGIAKRRDTTFGADAGAREKEQAVGGSKGQSGHEPLRELEIFLPEGAHGAVEMNGRGVIGNPVLAHWVDHRFKENAVGDELIGEGLFVLWMDIVVVGAVDNQKMAGEIARMFYEGDSIVGVAVAGGELHQGFRPFGIVVMPVRDRSYGDAGFDLLGAGHDVERHGE